MIVNKSFIYYGLLLFATLLITMAFVYYYLYCHRQRNIDGFTNSVLFLSEKEISTFLLEDTDRYVRNMSSADLRARNVGTPEEYINRISVCDINNVSITDEEKNLITKCTLAADSFLETYEYKNHINGKDIAKIPWKIAIVCNEYEEGFPHTRKDIIFLSKRSIKVNKEQLTALLIHEKVHLYQRYNASVMERFLASIGYTVAGYASDPKYILRRSNPDINDKIYYDTHLKKEMIYMYTSDSPQGINDIQGGSVEHPYEMMAYDIANDYLRNYLKDIVSKL